MMRHVDRSVLIVLLGLGGCSIGPGSIAMNRPVYSEVINRTEDEQLLNLIVRDRYNETYGMLAVASVTASLRARADLQAQFGLTRKLSEDYEGNLVPLAGGVAYEENPTISYVPIGGERFVQRLLSPLSTEELLLIGQYLPSRRGVCMSVALRSINGVVNPLVVEDGTGTADFARIIDLLTALSGAGVSRTARNAEGEFQLVFNVVRDEHKAMLDEVLNLTGVEKRPADGHLCLSVRAAAQARSVDALNLESRSVIDILRTAGDCIEVPEAHLKAGVADPNRGPTPDGFMRIRTSRQRPDGVGAVAVKYRNWWYYIDDADPASKYAFQFLRTLVGLRLSDRGKESEAPVLTIPVR